VSSIVILGAGDLGGALARRLAAADVVGRVSIVDDAATVAAGKALDIAQAAPIDRYATRVTGGDDLSAVVGAAVIVIADVHGPTSTEWQDDAGLGLVKRIAGLNQVAPIVCAGARQASIIERGVRELGMARTRLFGTAPEGLRAAIIGMTALEADASPADVMLSVVGRPPSDFIVSWDEASIAGRAATSVLSPPAITRLDARLPRLWPPGPTTLAGAAVRGIHAALSRSPRVLSALVAVDRTEGEHGRVVVLPITLQPSGIASLVAPSLSIRDRVRLDSVLHG
jgi:malate dehydrogenase